MTDTTCPTCNDVTAAIKKQREEIVAMFATKRDEYAAERNHAGRVIMSIAIDLINAMETDHGK